MVEGIASARTARRRRPKRYLAGARFNQVTGRGGTRVALVLAGALTAMWAAPALAASGDLDATFGGDGKVVTHFEGGGSAGGVAIQADGKVVAAGSTGGRFAVARYGKDGTPDASFGGDGTVTTDFTTGADEAFAVAIQGNGKIVVAGVAGDRIVGEVRGGRFALARYNPTGTPDATFGGDGRVTTNFTDGFDSANGVAIQGNGKIVAAGGASGSRFALARYDRDGTLDSFFSGDGKVTTSLPQRVGGQAYGVAIQGDGKIVAAGVRDFYGFALARYHRNGALDHTFSGDGRVVTTVGWGEEAAKSVAIQADEKIVAAGYTDVPHEAGDAYGPGRFALARYRADGTLDPAFGGDGTVTTRFGASGSSANAVAIDHSGRIVAAGSGHGGFALARYEHDGTLDTTFGGDGRVTTRFTAGVASGVAVQVNERIVAVGSSAAGFALARYL
ncbi:MAG: delta-60 repeat domain-containing protein [Actinomycetota bacterium]